MLKQTLIDIFSELKFPTATSKFKHRPDLQPKNGFGLICSCSDEELTYLLKDLDFYKPTSIGKDDIINNLQALIVDLWDHKFMEKVYSDNYEVATKARNEILRSVRHLLLDLDKTEDVD